MGVGEPAGLEELEGGLPLLRRPWWWKEEGGEAAAASVDILAVAEEEDEYDADLPFIGAFVGVIDRRPPLPFR